MATKEDEKDSGTPVDPEGSSGGAPSEVAPETSVEVAPATEAAAATTLGAGRYVLAAFFLAGVLGAFLAGKLLGAGWSYLAEWPAAVRAVPALLSFSEDERGSITQTAGAVVGALGVIQAYRKESVRTWAAEVASELSQVTWPAKDVVTNGTIVVVATSVVATIYVTILDKFWGFVTDLIYRV